MIETLGTVLPIIIYFLLIIFLIVVIVLGIKIIITVDTLNSIILDVQRKVASLDSIFRFADNMASKFSFLGNKVVDSTVGTITRLFSKKRKGDE